MVAEYWQNTPSRRLWFANEKHQRPDTGPMGEAVWGSTFLDILYSKILIKYKNFNYYFLFKQIFLKKYFVYLLKVERLNMRKLFIILYDADAHLIPYLINYYLNKVH